MGRMVRVVAAVALMVVLSTGAAFAATLGGTAAGDGYDTVQKGSDMSLDRFVGCEKFVG